MKFTLTFLLAIVSLLVVACDSDSGISAVTALPEGAAEEIANQPTRTPLPITPDVSDTPLPTDTPDMTNTPLPTANPVVTEIVLSATPAVTEVPEESNTVTPIPVTDPESGEELAPTPTPLDNNLAAGEARAIALATDVAFAPTPRNELLSFDENPVPLVFDEFYEAYDMRRGWIISDKLISLDGYNVEMEGYIAPPLKPELDFFVLTQIPLDICPFCSTDADWPDRIALVYLPEADLIDNRYPVRIVGQLEVGSSIDVETGMVSLVRLYAEEVEQLR